MRYFHAKKQELNHSTVTLICTYKYSLGRYTFFCYMKILLPYTGIPHFIAVVTNWRFVAISDFKSYYLWNTIRTATAAIGSDSSDGSGAK
jgi:hypothetical protein